ncbi:MAG: hypothetical protein ACRDCW_02590 [Sarcina sp.]
MSLLQNEIEELKRSISGIGVVQPQVKPVVVSELTPFDYYIMGIAIEGKY